MKLTNLSLVDIEKKSKKNSIMIQKTKLLKF